MPPEKDKIVIFEHLRLAGWPLLLFYACAGFKVCYLRMKTGFDANKFLRKFLPHVTVEKFSAEGLDYASDVACNCHAMRDVEPVYQAMFARDRIVARVQALAGSEIACSSYKKALADELYDLYWVKACVEQFRGAHRGALLFIPEMSIGVWSWLSSAKVVKGSFADGIGAYVPFVGQVYSFLLRGIDWLKWRLGFLVFPLWVLSKIRRVVRGDVSRKKYQAGIRVYATDMAFYHKYRTIDFLLDGKGLNKDNVLFCAETDIPDIYREEFRKRGYDLVDIPGIMRSVNAVFLVDVLVKNVFCLWAASLTDLFLSPSLSLRVSIKDLYTYIQWQRFLGSYHLENFVVYNDYAYQAVIRNMLLSGDKTVTWYYLHSRDFGDSFMPDATRHEFRWRKLSYFYYDNFLVYANADTFLKEHPHHVRNYLSIGCLWSEQIDVMSKEKVCEDLKITDKVPGALCGPVIGVFNTDFGEHVPLKLDDMVAFVEGILKLLEAFPGVTVILKEKYARDWVNSKIIPYFQRLEAHPRCVLPGCSFEATEIIRVSDLTIGACFTSPVHEALGAGKKAFYFDALGRFKGTHYDRYPRLVAHGLGELISLTSYWLNEVTDEVFNDYLQVHINKGLKNPPDMRAITRFRELLLRRG